MHNFQKPENALKRAAELRSIGLNDEALQILHSAIGHRFFRIQGWDMIQEQIMLEYVALCIEQDKLRLARDGLHQYRLVAQHANVASLGKVVVELLDHAEVRLKTIKEKTSAEVEQAKIDYDSDYEESPEKLMASTLQIEVRDSAGRQLHAVYRFLWETYKMILDIMRATPKLEKVYHDTARKAILFCKENERVSEFKRLCDVLRGHYAFLYRHKHKPEMECMLKPELHIETRINQLIAACDMGLWKEAFNTVEDLYSLGIRNYIAKTFQGTVASLGQQKEKLLKWLAIFYEKLALIFWVAGLHLFHALAVLRYVMHIRMYKKRVTDEDVQYMCSKCVLAVLAIPSHLTNPSDPEYVTNFSNSNFEMQRRMTTLLGYNTIPTGDSLHAVLLNKGILQLADENTRKIYELMEGDSQNAKLSLCVELIPLLQDHSNKRPESASVETEQESIYEKNPAQLQQKGISFFDPLPLYYPKLKSVVFHKVLLKISKVYASMTIDHFVKCICPSEFYHWNHAEKQLVPLVHQGLCRVRLDYANRILHFNATSTTSNSIGPIRLHLTDLGKNLYYAMRLLNPHESEQNEEERRLMMISVRSGMEKERARLLKRTSEIYQRRQVHQEEQMRAEEERKKLEMQNKLNEERAEKERREEVLRQMEMQRRKDEKFKMKSETAQQMLEAIRKIGGAHSSKITIKGKTLDEISVEDVMDGFVDYDDLEKAQEQQRARERMEIIKQRKQEVKRIDHFVRAVRELEMNSYEAWQQQVLEHDKAILEEVKKLRQVKHEADCEQARLEKELFKQFVAEKNEWVESKMVRRREEYQAELDKQRARLLQLLKRDKIQRARNRRAEELRRQEEERRLQERLQREREQQLAKQREEERQQKLAQQAEKQRARELEIERKMQQQQQHQQQQHSHYRHQQPQQHHSVTRSSEATSDSWRQSASTTSSTSQQQQQRDSIDSINNNCNSVAGSSGASSNRSNNRRSIGGSTSTSKERSGAPTTTTTAAGVGGDSEEAPERRRKTSSNNAGSNAESKGSGGGFKLFGRRSERKPSTEQSWR